MKKPLIAGNVCEKNLMASRPFVMGLQTCWYSYKRVDIECVFVFIECTFEQTTAHVKNTCAVVVGKRFFVSTLGFYDLSDLLHLDMFYSTGTFFTWFDPS